MADEIKKTTDEVKENIENTQEGVMPDDAAKDVVGGFFPSSHYKPALKRLEIEKNNPQIRE